MIKEVVDMGYSYLLVGLLCVILLFSGCVGSSTETELSSGNVKAGDNYSAVTALNDWKNIVSAISSGKTVKCEYLINDQTVTMILSKYKNYIQFYGLAGASATNAQTEFKDGTIVTYIWQENGSMIPEEYIPMYAEYGINIPAGKKIGTKDTTQSTEEKWKSSWDYDPDSKASSSEAQFDMSWKCVITSYAFNLPEEVYFLDQQELSKNMGGE